MASLSWTDSLGAATLSNLKPDRGSRLADFRPISVGIGDVAHALGDNVRYTFKFSTRYGCTFAITQIPNSELALMDRLALHLDDGGVVTLATEDSASRTYTTLQLVEGAELPHPELTDKALLEYTMRFALFDARGSLSAPMLCVY